MEIEPILMGTAVQPVEILHAYHLLDIMRDTPYVQRPPTLIIFHHDGCSSRMSALGLDTTYLRGLPSRGNLLVARYHVENQYKSLWYHLDERKMDLENVLGLVGSNCPKLVMVSREFAYENRSAGRFHMELWEDVEAEKENEVVSIDWKLWVQRHVLFTFAQSGQVRNCGQRCFTAREMKTRDRVETNSHERGTFIASQMPTFTVDGFKKTRMPEELFLKLREFYVKWKHEEKVEDWGIASQINFHEVQTSMVSLDLDPVFRNVVAHRFVRPIVEKWALMQNLELTAFYGIRSYYRGSELRMHIDRTETHVLSAILNIDQVGMDEDWMLEVIDHNGSRVEISMAPGDLVLYESISVPHGRPRPLKGDKYLNAFCHFRPRGWKYDVDGRILVDDSNPPTSFNHKRVGRMSSIKSCPIENKRLRSAVSTESSQGKLFLRNFVPEVVQISRVTSLGEEIKHSELPYRYQQEVGSFVGEAWRVRYVSNNSLIQEFVVDGFDRGLRRKTFIPCAQGEADAVA